jgi:hypothetical protein
MPSISGPESRKTGESYEISHPTFENIEIRKVLVDPSLREQDCRKGRYVIAQIFTDANGLDELRNDDVQEHPDSGAVEDILSAGSEATTDSMGPPRICPGGTTRPPRRPMPNPLTPSSNPSNFLNTSPETESSLSSSEKLSSVTISVVSTGQLSSRVPSLTYQDPCTVSVSPNYWWRAIPSDRRTQQVA